VPIVVMFVVVVVMLLVLVFAMRFAVMITSAAFLAVS
jgi:hypothetical protein